jgi:hypothetical protein
MIDTHIVYHELILTTKEYATQVTALGESIVVQKYLPYLNITLTAELVLKEFFDERGR